MQEGRKWRFFATGSGARPRKRVRQLASRKPACQAWFKHQINPLRILIGRIQLFI